MYTALLVDDEPAVLDILKNSISWTQFGIGTLLTAGDGEQALAQLQSNAVHLLITDIQMPRMDGVRLVEKVRELYPHIHCIFLTAFSEFEYAKAALQLGVENYILKPFSQDELENTIEKALDNLYKNVKNNAGLFKDNILMRWANNDINENELSERALYLGINIYCKQYCIICLKKTAKCSLEAFIKQLHQQVANKLELQHFWSDTGLCFLIIGGHDLSSEYLNEQFSLAINQTKYTGMFLAFSGEIVNGANRLFHSYRQANELLSANAPTDGTQFISYEVADMQLQNTYRKNLVSIYALEDAEERSACYLHLVEQLLPATGQDKQTLFTVLSNSLQQLFEQLYPQKPEIRMQLYNRIQMYADADLEHCTDTAVQLLEVGYLLYQYHFGQLSPVIQFAINYIHTSYPESISLKEFCVKNKMNTAYLGSLFKKETGMFFNNYLAQYRICCSLRMLDETELQINDIAIAVGFTSPSYFITCFKKQLGVSPIKYRSLHV